MCARVNRLLACRAVASVCLLASLAARADEPAPSLDERWIPSFAITSGVMFGRQHASVSSDCRATGIDPPSPASCDPVETDYGPQLRPGAFDDEQAVTPHVGGNLSLLSPVLFAPGRLRVFAGIEMPYQFGIDRNVAQRQRPTGLREPDNPNVTEALDESSLLGAGSRTASEVQGLTFGANVGVAVHFEAFGRQLRLKPAASWLREQIRVRGRVEQGICPNTRPPPNELRDDCDLDGEQFPGVPGFTRVITLKADDDQWFDGVGPTLDLEMDTGRFGPYTVSLFLGAGAYYIFSDRTMAFSTQRTIGPDSLGDPVDYHADFTFRVNPWLYRAGVGLRLSWVGYD